jgi:hypothetical protein
MGLSPVEFWASAITMCVIGIVFFGFDAFRELAHEDDPYRWGDPQRGAKVWATHDRCAAAVMIGLALFLGAMVPH